MSDGTPPRAVTVLVNEVRQYGLHPADLPAPAGWWPAGFTGPEELAVGWVDEHWTEGAR
ncbi:MbtH family NRPS accessory protein [Kitasatospora sp. NPDC048365]|uniref:MbtH-like domain-containing protein n=1 Tax=Kitasatospora terrestris TaxID=258051 RepID=A0ABP9DQW7_9ACTN